jgi:hypothetical protein
MVRFEATSDTFTGYNEVVYGKISYKLQALILPLGTSSPISREDREHSEDLDSEVMPWICHLQTMLPACHEFLVDV